MKPHKLLVALVVAMGFVIAPQALVAQNCQGLALQRGETGITSNIQLNDFTTRGVAKYNMLGQSGLSWGLGAGFNDHDDFPATTGFVATGHVAQDFSEPGSQLTICPVYQTTLSAWSVQDVTVTKHDNLLGVGIGDPLQISNNVVLTPYITPFLNGVWVEAENSYLHVVSGTEFALGTRGGFSLRMGPLTTHAAVTVGTDHLEETSFLLGLGYAM